MRLFMRLCPAMSLQRVMLRHKALCLVSIFMFCSVLEAKILPENDLHLEDNIFSRDTNITEDEFNEIIDELIDIYKPIADKHNAKLSVIKNWHGSTVNAYASRSGSRWRIFMYGGLARRSELTKDGFALVVCHEIGHHFAGFPYKNSWDGSIYWAASEGQSDYFATHECIKKVWASQINENEKFRKTINKTAKAECNRIWPNSDQQNLCYRIAEAGKSLADLFYALEGQTTKTSFDSRSVKTVSKTSTAHPQGQCRLDTYFAGALCDIDFDENLIPGLINNKPKNNSTAEKESYKYTCSRFEGYDLEARPRCWYKPSVF